MIFLETEKTELKQSVDKDLARKIVAFLNTDGGIIYIGIEDKTGNPIGLKNIDESMIKISNAINDQIYPTAKDLCKISSFKEGDVTLIKIIINKSRTLHYLKEYGLTPKGTPIRVGTELREMNEYEIKRKSFSLLRNELNITGIASLYQNLTFNKLKNYFIEKGLTINEDQFLNNIPGIYTEEGHFSLMAELLSDKNNIQVIVAIFQGKDKTVFARRTPFGGTCLIDIYYKVLDYCQSVINDVTTIKHNEKYTKVGRIDFRRFDNKAFEEAWLNAITYNDWVTENPPIICVYDDKIEITSSGSLPDGQTIDGFFKGKSKFRSKELFDLFNRLELGEHTGHGVKTILEKYNNDKSIFDIGDNYVTVTLTYPNEVTKEIERFRSFKINNGELNGELNLSIIAKETLALIKKNNKIISIEIAEKLNKGKRTIDRAIAELQSFKVIERIGSKKDGYWKIIK